MRNVSGDGGAVLPWLLIRQDARGNRYRVGSYGTRAEAQETADRLGGSDGGGSGGAVGSDQAVGQDGGGADAYLVESRDQGEAARG